MFKNISRNFAFLPQEVVIVAAKRTPIGSFMGSLSSISAPQLASISIKACLSQSNLVPNQITEVILGHVLSSGVGQSPSRQAAIAAGLPHSTVCFGINKVCASGMKAVTIASEGLSLGNSEIVVAGGMENMSLAPFLLPNYRAGQLMGDAVVVDSITHDGLFCPFNKQMMGSCAEKTVEKYQITREEQDNYCIRSYKKSAEAWGRGFFKDEVEIVEVQTRKGNIRVDQDEEFKKVKVEKIPTLKPAFEKNGTITAANASSINDGACALILMTAERAKTLGINPLAKVLAFADAEGEPVHFSVAPKEAIMTALERASINKGLVDLFEINEAFSSVALANAKLLGLDLEKVNVNGGAVSLGHPIGMSGARIVATLIYALREQNKRIGVAAVCNGGGGATAVVVEAI
jgi:acetyl-CoA C-acetyltransferase